MVLFPLLPPFQEVEHDREHECSHEVLAVHWKVFFASSVPFDISEWYHPSSIDSVRQSHAEHEKQKQPCFASSVLHEKLTIWRGLKRQKKIIIGIPVVTTWAKKKTSLTSYDETHRAGIHPKIANQPKYPFNRQENHKNNTINRTVRKSVKIWYTSSGIRN